ncbi:hypothetical protein OP10G_3347 [Fimbriimonas ginsengisoli Gsoil 348]|uniref:Uncharacterized protein n=1 Tax=Fimbriimonas ginsengisoli Gsoil 348 TaxID=661478 RepID=A0A068NVB6_FIMGI|nr:hypothetical protein OP10G_3347 [Fimbriimonas ginsengisoli Gsoil 348]
MMLSMSPNHAIIRSVQPKRPDLQRIWEQISEPSAEFAAQILIK